MVSKISSLKQAAKIGGVMLLTCNCKACGASFKVSAEVFNGGQILCPSCGEEVKYGGGKSNEASKQETVPVSPIKSRFRAELNVEQEMAASYDGPAGAILVLAGAGCGKTRTMIARALFLLFEKHAAPERMAMLTFTRRAAREIEERIELELPGAARRMNVGTFHRFCLNLIHRFHAYFDMESLKIMDKGDQEIILRRIRKDFMAKKSIDEHLEGKMPSESNLAYIFSFINNSCLSVEEYFEKNSCVAQADVALVSQVYDMYTDYKRRNCYLDFDDILKLVADKLETSAEFRRAVQNRFDYILVDEMQDTSPIQWRVIKNLYPPVKLFCVGDDAQSIYSFRGADFKSVHSFCEMLPNAITLKLTENYRSTQKILDVSNMLLASSPLKYSKELHAHSMEEGKRPILMEFWDEDAEALRVVKMIAQHLNDGMPPNEIMVMMRGSRDGRMIEMYLKNYGIEYRLIGGTSFLQTAHVKDVVSILEALTTVQNELSWIRFLTLLPHIGMKSAEKLYSYIENIEKPDDARNIMAKNLTFKNPEVADFMGKTFNPAAKPDEMLMQIVDFLDERQILALKYDKWDERRKDLDVLIGLASQYASLSSFMESFKLDPDAEVPNKQRKDVVTLITVHSAKGTEADLCFVLRVQPGTYPHYRSENDDEIEEDRRVLYVAMTRARKELYLTSVKSGFGQGYYSSGGFLTDEMRSSLAESKRRRYSDYEY